MATDYNEFVQLAQELIAENGRSVKLQKLDATSSDPSKPWKGPGAPTVAVEKTLPAGKISLPCLAQVYMDWRVETNEDGTQFILPAGDPISTNASWEIIVNAYAIQANGIANVDAAVDAYANNGK